MFAASRPASGSWRSTSARLAQPAEPASPGSCRARDPGRTAALDRPAVRLTPVVRGNRRTHRTQCGAALSRTNCAFSKNSANCCSVASISRMASPRHAWQQSVCHVAGEVRNHTVDGSCRLEGRRALGQWPLRTMEMTNTGDIVPADWPRPSSTFRPLTSVRQCLAAWHASPPSACHETA